MMGFPTYLDKNREEKISFETKIWEKIDYLAINLGLISGSETFVNAG